MKDAADLIIDRIESSRMGPTEDDLAYTHTEAPSGLPEVPKGALKADFGKPPMAYISRDLMVALAEVRAFGSKKYTRYKTCNCAPKTADVRSILEECVELVMTSGSKVLIQSTKEPKEKTQETGLKEKGSTLTSTTKVNLETIQLKGMGSLGNKWTRCLTLDANSAEKLLASASIIATLRELLEGPYAPHVTSASVGSKSPDLSIRHSPTCASHEIANSGVGDWKKGFAYSRSTSAALRHIFAFLDGEDKDPESGLSHIAHAIASLEHLINDINHHPENDDRT